MSSILFSVIMLLLPLAIFLLSIYFLKKRYERESSEPEEKQGVMVY